MLLSNFHYEILQHIADHEFISGTDLEMQFPKMKMRFQEALPLLMEEKLIFFTTNKDEASYLKYKSLEQQKLKSIDWYSECYHLFLTEHGHAILETYQKEKEEFERVKNDSYFAKKTSVAAIVVSAISILANVIISLLW